MSNRVNNVLLYARSCRKLVADPARTHGWAERTCQRLVEITRRLQELAADADALYARLREAADQYDPELVEPADGIYVLHCHEDNLALVEVFRTIWSDNGGSFVESESLKQEVDRLLADHSWIAAG